MRNAYCSLLAAESVSKLTSRPPAPQPQGHLHYQAAARRGFNIAKEPDGIMDKLQELIDSHQRELDKQLQDQPCSSSSLAGLSSGGNLGGLQCGGSSSNSSNNNNILQPGTLPLSNSDDLSTNLKQTIVAGEVLYCFVIGGECRLAFPEMVVKCLMQIPTYKVDEMMKNLAIINPLASTEQLKILKTNGVIPKDHAKCELMTKTNAERLIAKLKPAGFPAPIELLNAHLRRLLSPLHVAHDCFGGCTAFLYSSLIPNACLECQTCHEMFKPEDFCRHTHKPANKNICYWGFDASNWPYYLRIDDEDLGVDFRNGQLVPRSIEDAENRLAIFIRTFLAVQQQAT